MNSLLTPLPTPKALGHRQPGLRRLMPVTAFLPGLATVIAADIDDEKLALARQGTDLQITAT